MMWQRKSLPCSRRCCGCKCTDLTRAGAEKDCRAGLQCGTCCRDIVYQDDDAPLNVVCALPRTYPAAEGEGPLDVVTPSGCGKRRLWWRPTGPPKQLTDRGTQVVGECCSLVEAP